MPLKSFQLFFWKKKLISLKLFKFTFQTKNLAAPHIKEENASLFTRNKNYTLQCSITPPYVTLFLYCSSKFSLGFLCDWCLLFTLLRFCPPFFFPHPLAGSSHIHLNLTISFLLSFVKILLCPPCPVPGETTEPFHRSSFRYWKCFPQHKKKNWISV